MSVGRVSLTVLLQGDEQSGYDVVLLDEQRGDLVLGRVEGSGDPQLPWLTSAGQLETSLQVAALKLAGARLEDEDWSLRSGLS